MRPTQVGPSVHLDFYTQCMRSQDTWEEFHSAIQWHWNDVPSFRRLRDRARLAIKSVRTPSQPAFRPSMGGLSLHAEPEAGALVPNTNTRFTARLAASRQPSHGLPSAGAEKWEKWRKWLACQKYEVGRTCGLHCCIRKTQTQAQRRRQRFDLNF